MILLIVDDQPDVVQGIQQGIDWARIGIDRILTANSVSVAERLLKAEKIDILLCDIEMPPRNGIELLSLIRTAGLETYCIFLSAHAEFTYAQEAVHLGAFDYILQPAPYDEIEAAVERALSSKMTGFGEQLINDDARRIIKDSESEQQADHIQVLMDYIRQNLSGSLSRQELADVVHLNPEYLSRLFKRETDVSISQFIQQEKLKLAESMLRETTIPISLIAVKVGYTNFSYFSQVFKRQTGLSPQDYRKMHTI